MSVSDIVLWLVVAVGAFLIGQSRIRVDSPVQQFWHSMTSADRDDAESTLIAHRRWVLGFIVRSYSLEELHSLAFDLGVLWDGIGGATINERGRELIVYCERNGLIGALLDAFGMKRT